MKKLVIAFGLLSSLPLFSQPAAIRVMSYNIRLDVKSDGENQWDKRKEKLAAMLNFYEPDFIGAQEVMHHQLQYLLEQLKGYTYIGVGRDDGKEAGEYSCIFYKKNKCKLLKQSTFWLSPTPDSVSKGWDAAIVRVCTYGQFRDKKTKQRFWVFNTHFDHIGKQARLESAKLIVQKIKELTKAGEPVVVTGDFNSRPDDEPARYMVTELLNARTVSHLIHGREDTWNGFQFSETPNGCIDYIFVSKDERMDVVKFATLTDSYERKYLSDHFPVMADIVIKK